MSKLLTEPRIPKEITAPKKKTRRKKASSEDFEVKHTIIKEGKSISVDELFKIYKANPFNARVKYFNSGHKYTYDRSCIFEKGPVDFEICVFRNNFGISVTNRIYSSQKKLYSISYKNGKLWYINKIKNRISPLSYGSLLEFIGYAETISIWGHQESDKLKKSKTWEFMVNKFPWLKMISEHPVSMGVNLNVVKTKKMTSTKDINRHVLGVPNNIAQMVIESGVLSKIRDRNDGIKPMSVWKNALKYLDGVQNLNLEMLKSHYFFDSIKMAKTLGRKVNCKWGEKRLKEEHDAWAREIGNIVLDCEEEYDLNIRREFIAFAEFSGYKLLKTNKEMLIEGMIQDHCVGTYITEVERGRCAIFHVDGYTLQVGIGTQTIREPEKMEIGPNGNPIRIPQTRNVEIKELKNLQFRGKHNNAAPPELVARVNAELKRFGTEGMFDTINEVFEEVLRKKSNNLDMLLHADNELPF